jgi:hypothetical protein
VLLVSVIFSHDPFESPLRARKAGLQVMPIPRARTKNGVKTSREHFTTLPFKGLETFLPLCQKKARRIAWIIRWSTGETTFPLIFQLNFIVTCSKFDSKRRPDEGSDGVQTLLVSPVLCG